MGGTAFAIANVVKFVAEWQFAQAVVPIGIWFEGSTTVAGVPTNVRPRAWQVLHESEETTAWFIGGLLFVTWKVVKFDAEWQLSQLAVPNGTWLFGGTFSAGGIMFAKLEPVAWHCAQLAVMFA